VAAVLALDLHPLRNPYAVSHSSANPISGSHGPAGRSCRRASTARGLAVQIQRQHRRRCPRQFTLSSPTRKIHQAPFTCLEPDRELFNPSWMLLDLVMSKKNAADIQIDHLHSRAICDEIGERLRQAIRQESVGLPPQLQLLVDRLAELDGAAAPSIVPSFEDMLPRRELHSSRV
jgi:hypothetical protein